MPQNRLLAYLGVNATWLNQLEKSGEGPPSAKIGRQKLYRRSDVDAWLAARQSKISPVATPDSAVDALEPARRPYRALPAPKPVSDALTASYVAGELDPLELDHDLAIEAVEAAIGLVFAGLDWPDLPARAEPGDNPTECARKIQARMRAMARAGVARAIWSRVKHEHCPFVLADEIVLRHKKTGARLVLDARLVTLNPELRRQDAIRAREAGDTGEGGAGDPQG